MSYPQLAQAIRAMREAKQQIRQLGNEDTARRREIRNDRDLTSEARAIALRKLTEENRAKVASLRQKYNQAKANAERFAKHVENVINVDPEARARVRELLDEGFAPSQIRQRARDLGDHKALTALLIEMRWFGAGGQFADSRETIDACHRDLAELGHGDISENSRLVLDADVAKKGAPETAAFAETAIDGSPSDVSMARLRMAFADGGDE